MKWTALFLLLVGCGPKPVPPPAAAPQSIPVTELHFPVIVFFGQTSVGTFKDADDLGTIYINQLTAVDGPPPLVDSQFNVYRLAKFRSTHGDLWLMAHPSGGTPVTFELQRAEPSGIEAARALMRQWLDQQTWRHDLDQSRRALASEKTFSGMLKIVHTENE